MVPRGEKRSVLPPVFGGINSVVNREKPRVTIFAHFSEINRALTATDSRQILTNHNVVLPAFDPFFEVVEFLAVKVFPAADT